MPRISQFFGITIAMFYRDHAPPHFHAYYQDAEALIDIRTFALLEGRLPPRQLGLAVEWAAKRQAELLRNWDRARSNQPLDAVLPLE
ncbi:MAG: DUF4160 domain-containing protein [Phycisphaerales bacterium]|nr:DUF4160 domain-containing protein [Phycisphaerales bacterium]MCB9841273.1 DUF4160 domain-containing protein [Phycisphaeraceae bacterium]